MRALQIANEIYVGAMWVASHVDMYGAPKPDPTVSSQRQLIADVLDVGAVTADVVALSVSSAGALAELGLVAVDANSPIGDTVGLALYYQYVNVIENGASFVGFALTAFSDVFDGYTYVELGSGINEISIGQDTFVSASGLLVGNQSLIPLEGITDSVVNVSLVLYDVYGAADQIPILLEIKYDSDKGWFMQIYDVPEGEHNE